MKLHPPAYKPLDRRTLALLLLLGTALLCAQMATLDHAAGHAFHHHTEQCDNFLFFGHSALLPTGTAGLAFALLATLTFAAIRAALLSRTFERSSIRAPPALYLPSH